MIKEGYTRVTTILYPFSGLTKIPDAILKMAAERGSAVHECCDAIIKGFDPDELPDAWKPFIDSFLKWHEGKVFIETPDRFYDDAYMITGECDAIYVDNGELVLVDFKTSACESKTWPRQGSAYSHMARQIGFKISRIEFVKLDKTGKAPEVFVYEEEFDRFLACLELYNEFFKDMKVIEHDDL